MKLSAFLLISLRFRMNAVCISNNAPLLYFKKDMPDTIDKPYL